MIMTMTSHNYNYTLPRGKVPQALIFNDPVPCVRRHTAAITYNCVPRPDHDQSSLAPMNKYVWHSDPKWHRRISMFTVS